MSRPTTEERFWKFVLQRNDGCWIWQGCARPDGYGRFSSEGRIVRSHRWAYLHFVGPVAAGLELDHLCRNRACCNPAHLEPVTHTVNVQRGAIATKTHCLRGHDLAPENVWLVAGRRHCKICTRYRKRLNKRGISARGVAA